MDAIKKFFKDFYSFYRLTRVGADVGTASSYMRKQFWMILVIVFSTFFVCLQFYYSGGNSGSLNILILFLAFAGFGIGLATAIKPSLLAVAPFSPKQRVVYSYMSAVLNAIIISAFVIAISIMMILFVALLNFILFGENILVYEEDYVGQVLSPYARGLAAEFNIIFIFGLFAASHVNGSKNRVYALLGFFGGLEVLILILNNVCANIKAASKHFYLFHDVLAGARGIDSLAHPWIPIVIGAIIAAGAIALSLWSCINRHKSSKI